MINPVLTDHHKRVSYIAYKIADEIGFSMKEQKDLIYAGLLHDSGALSLEERFGALNFESENRVKNYEEHASAGYFLYSKIPNFQKQQNYKLSSYLLRKRTWC